MRDRRLTDPTLFAEPFLVTGRGSGSGTFFLEVVATGEILSGQPFVGTFLVLGTSTAEADTRHQQKFPFVICLDTAAVGVATWLTLDRDFIRLT